MIVSEPIVIAGGVAGIAVGVKTDVLGAYTSSVWESEVCSASTVVEEPEPSVMVEPAARVEPEIMY